MNAPALEPPPGRLVWLNGPPGAGQRRIGCFLQRSWQVAMLDADELGLVLTESMPPPMRVDAVDQLVAWHDSIRTLAIGLARAWPPLLVMPITLYQPRLVAQLLDAHRTEIDVVHAVVAPDEDHLRDEIHRGSGDREAKRRALEAIAPALTGLANVPDSVYLDPRHGPERLAEQLARELHGRGWLTADGHWAVTR